MTTYTLQRPGHGSGWIDVSTTDDPAAAFRAEVEHVHYECRTVMDTEQGRILVKLRRGIDAGKFYYWACCAVRPCVSNAHYDNGHTDFTGESWAEDVPLL